MVSNWTGNMMPARMRRIWGRNRSAAHILVWNSVSEPVYTYAVTVLTEQESDWVSELANRLRLIQADAVSSTPEKRREFLQEEVARHFKPVPPANRKRFLEALLARFPIAGQVM